MKTSPFDYGFRVVGGKTAKRRPIEHAAAFAAYAECDPRADIEKEAYLSHFVFDRGFVEYLERNGSEAAFNGPCAAPWLWWDVDRPNDLGAALADAGRLCGAILDRYRDFDDDDLLVFLSGGKGVHIGIPAVWHPEPSPSFHGIGRRFCTNIAEAAGVVVDPTIYSKTRLFRAPNSRHASGLFKRRLSVAELTHLKTTAVVELARRPEPFEIPDGPALCLVAAEDWRAARLAVESAADRQTRRRDGPAKLSAFARRFVRDGETGDCGRETSTFRVAAELTELYLSGDIDRLVHALLEEAALDSGLSPSEVKHAIDGGLTHARRQREGGAA
jgi:hypothetical protein